MSCRRADARSVGQPAPMSSPTSPNVASPNPYDAPARTAADVGETAVELLLEVPWPVLSPGAAERRCPAGGLHDGTHSGAYVVAYDDAQDPVYRRSDYQHASGRRCAFWRGYVLRGGHIPGRRAGVEQRVAAPTTRSPAHRGRNPQRLPSSARISSISAGCGPAARGGPRIARGRGTPARGSSKNATGMTTVLAGLDELSRARFQGRDAAGEGRTRDHLRRGVSRN